MEREREEMRGTKEVRGGGRQARKRMIEWEKRDERRKKGESEEHEKRNCTTFCEHIIHASIYFVVLQQSMKYITKKYIE